MDILDTVREMKPTYPASSQAPRRALHQEIARSRRRRPVGRIVAVALAGTAVAAVAVTATVLTPPGVVGQPQAASASTYLNETAASIRAAVAAPMEVTITTRHLGMIGGPNEKFLPFGNLRTDATAAVLTESSATYLSATDGTYSLTGRTDFHAAELFGNEAEVERTWTGYYGAAYPIGVAPATSTEVEPGGGDEDLPVSPTDFPADPAAFLAAWTSGLESQLVAEKAAAAKMPQDGEPETNGLYESIEDRLAMPAAEHMLNMLGHSVPILTASPEYRATFLEALALADGITVEEGTTADKVLVYETDDARFRLTINPEAGTIVKIEKFLLRVLPELWNKHTKDDPLVEVGTAPFLPEGVADFSASFTTAPAD
ncbi:MAG: hypothetical protein K0R99_623 [Microbacterium sp.]|jgi:hypothetical protein|uniref:hypothetical protein n=1 Tax=Microbacterium sp. TaxID=51671 RepID=UPI00262F85BC|nr:hypothetical protein [Microbacterium sp.]MDF2559177.1 hypothetical protein [Microbacterium sp.]